MNMSDIHAMPAQETKSRALPVVTAVVAAIMVFGLFGLPYLASSVDTSSSINPASLAGDQGTPDERAECQRITETLCILLESNWVPESSNSSFRYWQYAFASSESSAQRALLYIYDLAPVVSTTAGLDWWLEQCAGYDCEGFEIETPGDKVEELQLIDGTPVQARYVTYFFEDPTKVDIVTVGQSFVLLPATSNSAVLIVDLTLDTPLAYLNSLSETELQTFYSEIDSYFKLLVTQRIQVIGS
jgi:hypothetical protein